MAITKKYSPQYVAPVTNPMMFVYDSTNYQQSGFSYMMDYYITAGTGQYYERVTYPPNPSGYAEVNIGRILNTYIGYDFNPSLTAMTNPSNSYLRYSIKAGEKYIYQWQFDDDFYISASTFAFSSYTISSSSQIHYFNVGDRVYIDRGVSGETYNSGYSGVHTITAIPNQYSIITDAVYGSATPPISGVGIISDFSTTNFSGLNTSASGYVAHNAAIDTVDFIDYDYLDYNLRTGSTNGRFYTAAYNEFYIKLNSVALFNVISTATTNYTYLKVMTDSATGYEEFRIQRPSNITYGELGQIGIGTENLANVSATTLTTGSTLPVIKGNTIRYTAHTENSASARTSDNFIFIIDDYCSRFTNQEILFKDSKGSWLTFNFELVSQQAITSDKSNTYTKKLGTYNTTTQRWGYNSFDRGKTVITNERKYRYTASSNWLSFEQMVLFDELINSNEWYWRKDGNWVAIIVTTGEANRSFDDTEADPSNKTIQFELANDSLTQINS